MNSCERDLETAGREGGGGEGRMGWRGVRGRGGEGISEGEGRLKES